MKKPAGRDSQGFSWTTQRCCFDRQAIFLVSSGSRHEQSCAAMDEPATAVLSHAFVVMQRAVPMSFGEGQVVCRCWSWLALVRRPRHALERPAAVQHRPAKRPPSGGGDGATAGRCAATAAPLSSRKQPAGGPPLACGGTAVVSRARQNVGMCTCSSGSPKQAGTPAHLPA